MFLTDSSYNTWSAPPMTMSVLATYYLLMSVLLLTVRGTFTEKTPSPHTSAAAHN
jgi:hypothetical protein